MEVSEINKPLNSKMDDLDIVNTTQNGNSSELELN